MEGFKASKETDSVCSFAEMRDKPEEPGQCNTKNQGIQQACNCGRTEMV